MPLNWPNLKPEEQSFQSVLSAAFTIQQHNDQRKLAQQAPAIAEAPTNADADAGLACIAMLDCSCVPNHLVQEIAEQTLQATRANGVAIALGHEGKLICRVAAGDFGSEINRQIESGSGFTRTCISSGTVQLCNNTSLNSKPDADACRRLGISAVIAVPLFHQDRLLGMISVFSRRPYAFGIRSLQTLQDLAEKFAANLQVAAAPAKH